MKRNQITRAAVASALAATTLVALTVTEAAAAPAATGQGPAAASCTPPPPTGTPTPSATSVSTTPAGTTPDGGAANRPGGYYSGSYATSLDLASFNANLDAWLYNRKNVPPITTSDAIKWAKSAGFSAADLPAAYIPGYQATTMPSLPTPVIMAYARNIKALAAKLGVTITGTAVTDNLANPTPSSVALDVKRIELWTDVAAAMGAMDIQVVAGAVPSDLTAAGGWAAVAQERIVPALQTVTAYAASKGVTVELQNNGDMAATAAQAEQIQKWVGNQNLFLMDAGGSFEPFQATGAAGYDWYADIASELPQAADALLTVKPAGTASAEPVTDLIRVFLDLRLSGFQGYLPLDRLWAAADMDNPKMQPTPPYGEIAEFLGQVDAAMQATENDPFSSLRTVIADDKTAGTLKEPARHDLYTLVSSAGACFRTQQYAQAQVTMQQFQVTAANAVAAGQFTASAELALSAQMTEVQAAFNDTYGD